MPESAVRYGIFDVADVESSHVSRLRRQRLQLFTSALNGIINRLCSLNGKARYFRLERGTEHRHILYPMARVQSLLRARAQAAPTLCPRITHLVILSN